MYILRVTVENGSVNLHTVFGIITARAVRRTWNQKSKRSHRHTRRNSIPQDNILHHILSRSRSRILHNSTILSTQLVLLAFSLLQRLVHMHLHQVSWVTEYNIKPGYRYVICEIFVVDVEPSKHWTSRVEEKRGGRWTWLRLSTF